MAITAAELKILLSAKDEMSKVLQHVQGEMQTTSKEASVMDRVLSAAGGFLVRDVVIGSWNKLSGAVSGLASELVGTNKQWEIFEAQFYVQLGRSHAATKRRMQELETFAVKTPFELAEIIQADQLMQTFGLHTSQAAQRWGKAGDEIRTIAGDVAAGTRGSFSEISMWLGRFATGDTGMAIRRFQELGVTTRAELASMGIEFSKAGEMVTPIDKAMTILLAQMERKFGGLMEVESATLQGMQSNLADFMTVQARLWGAPVFEQYKDNLAGLMSFLGSDAVGEMMAIGQDLFATGVGWIGDMTREWGGGFAELIVNVFAWGANIIDQFAAGISGSNAISGALRNVANEITAWLKPGSPPKLLPNLDDWGSGAAESWLEGWGDVGPEVRGQLQRMGREIWPMLQELSEGGDIDPSALRERLGPNAPGLEGYLRSYERLFTATRNVAAAREELAEAETEGDEESIGAAREKLSLAETEESQAQQAMRTEQRKIADRMAQEQALLDAIRAQTEAAREKERVESDSDAKAAARAAEAEARAIRQAELQYKLAVAGTASGQIAIWEQELAKAEQGSAEWWQIQTRLVELRRKAAEEQGSGIAQAFTESYEEELGDGAEKVAVAGIDWGGIGSSIGTALIGGIRDAAVALPEEMLAWSESLLEWAKGPDAQSWFFAAGLTLGGKISDGLIGFVKSLAGTKPTEDSIISSLQTVVANLTDATQEIGLAIGKGILTGLLTEFMGGESALETANAIMDWLGEVVKNLNPINQAKFVWDLLTKTPRDVGRMIGDALFDPKPYGPAEPPGFASGTSSAPGGWSLVGEQGPELVNLPRGSQVVPAGETSQMMGSRTVNVGPGAVQVYVANGTAENVRAGVFGALQQIGVMA